MIFENPRDFIEHCKSDPIPALPIPLVAEHFGISSAAVMGRANRGTLELIEISGTKMILVRSLLAIEEESKRKKKVVYKELEGLARGGERRIFYDPIMTSVGLSWRVPAHRTEIGGILAAVSKKTFKKHDCMLSVLVHQKKAGRTMPGRGFFDLAKELGLEWSDDHKFVEKQTDLVLAKFRAE